MTERITITKADLETVMADWEASSRSGECLPPDQAQNLSIEEVARQSAGHVWDRLLGLGILVA